MSATATVRSIHEMAVLEPIDPSTASSLEDLSLDDPEERKGKVFASFLRACSVGDLAKVQHIIKTKNDAFNINDVDEDGITGLIYASCFGHVDVAFFLLEHGASISHQDKNGWTALHWATNNSHDETVRLLLEAGASIDVPSRYGRSVRDFVDHGLLSKRQKLVEVLTSDTRSNYSVPSSESGSRGEGSVSGGTVISATNTTADGYYVPSLYGVDYAEMCDIVGTQIPSALQNLAISPGKGTDNLSIRDNEDNGFDAPALQAYYAEEDEALVDFDYTQCLPDQMFVFGPDDMSHLLNVAIVKLSDPQLIRSHNNNPAGFTRRPVSANILFLAARYASYYCGKEMLDSLLNSALSMIQSTLQNKNDMMMMGYWLSNCSRLLYFLKKDTELVVITLEGQVAINELIQEIYHMLLSNAQKRIDAVLDESLFDYDTIPGYSNIQFEKKKIHPMIVLKKRDSPAESAFHRLSSYFSGGNSPPWKFKRNKSPCTPRTVSTILSSTLYVLQTFHIHPSLIHQGIAQLFYYIGATTFNRILSRPDLCCRWKAIQIRMNLSHLEDWVRSNHIPAPSKESFTKHLQLSIALLQLLQILTHMKDLKSFIDALTASPHLSILNWSHIRRSIDLYTYEVDEPRIPEEVEHYIADKAAKTEAPSIMSVRDVENDSSLFQKDKEDKYPSSEKPPARKKSTGIFDGSAGATSSVKKKPHSSDPIKSTELAEVVTSNLVLSGSLDPMNRARGPVIAISVPSNRTSPSSSGHSTPILTEGQASQSSCPSTPEQGAPTTFDLPYNFYMMDEKYMLPFAIPSNVGERIIVRIENGDEKYVEEAPVISEEVVKILDKK